MAAKTDRKGSGKLHVHSLSEAMGTGSKISVGTPDDIHLVRENAGRGAGKHPSAKPFTTKHKGEGWDGPKPKVTMPKKYSPKGSR